MDVIAATGLKKHYGATLAVDGIDFAVAAGQIVGLLGGNGAGKTTTIAMLLGLLIPTAGSIRILGHDMARDRFAALARMNFSSPYVALPQRLPAGKFAVERRLPDPEQFRHGQRIEILLSESRMDMRRENRRGQLQLRRRFDDQTA